MRRTIIVIIVMLLFVGCSRAEKVNHNDAISWEDGTGNNQSIPGEADITDDSFETDNEEQEPAEDGLQQSSDDNITDPTDHTDQKDSDADPDGSDDTGSVSGSDVDTIGENPDRITDNTGGVEPDHNTDVTKGEDPDRNTDTTPVEDQEPVSDESIAEIKADLNDTIAEINELLTKSSKGSGNMMAKLFGLTGILEDIEAAAQEAIDNGEAALNAIVSCNEAKELLEYQETLKYYKAILDENRELILEAKQNREISQLEAELNSLLNVIKEYNVYLMEVL